jgi:hypothetical protein
MTKTSTVGRKKGLQSDQTAPSTEEKLKESYTNKREKEKQKKKKTKDLPFPILESFNLAHLGHLLFIFSFIRCQPRPHSFLR